MKIDDMRVGYILPGHQPEIDEARAAPASYEELEPTFPTFSDRLNALQMPALSDWKQVLGLTEEAPSLTVIGPPPTPAGLRQNGPVQDDPEWRSFLSCYRAQPRLAGDSHPLHSMMDLLARFQQSTDRVRARALAGERQ